tara:strand:+ start:4288 stop:7080 length:2793 start_codon:yes stop_codon:yes gene_type:complete
MRIFINNYFPKLIFLGLSLIVFLPLVVSPETVFPFVVGKSLWLRGIIYSISCLWLMLIAANKKYLPEKNTLLLLFALFVLTQVISGIFNSSPLNSFWGNWERMEGIVEYFHWMIFILIAYSVLKTKLSWINLWKINTFVGLAVAVLGFFESLGLVIPGTGGLDIFPLVVNPAESYTQGERVESTIGNPSYLAAYLSMVTFSSIALIYREFKKNYQLSLINTYISLNASSKTFVIIATIGSFVSIWTILNSGSRGSLIGIALSALFISILLAVTNKKLRKFAIIPIISVIILIPIFYSITTIIESQKQELKREVLSKYLPSEDFEFGSFWRDQNATGESNEAISKIPEFAFVGKYDDIELSSEKSLTMQQLLQYMVDTGEISKSEMKSMICSDEILAYYWIRARESFRECTSTMRFISNFGSGISYPFRSGFNIGERGFAWKSALRGFSENPILGVGPENFPILHYKYIEINRSGDSPHFDRAHNRILHIMATSGIIGFISLALLWAYIGYIILKRTLKPDSENIFWILFGCFFISYVSYSMFNFSVAPIYLQIMMLIAFLIRSEQGFIKKDELEIDLSKESKEQSFVKDGLIVSLAVILPILAIIVIRSYVVTPFQAAKNTPPLGSPKSLIEVQDNINSFQPLANYGRQEILYIIGRDYEEMLLRAENAGNFAEQYSALKELISQEYNKAIEVEPNHFNIHFAATSLYLGLASYDANNLEIAKEILKKLEELAPNSIQTLEIKIRVALLQNDPVTAESLIELWREVMPLKWAKFWDQSLGIIKGEIIPEWETNCRNEEYPIDKPSFDDANILYTNDLDNGVIVGIKQEASGQARKIALGAIVTLDYSGWLSNGCLFDSSYLPDINTLTFKTGTGLAIPGFESALVGLGEGSIARIVIPPEMAYGAVGVKGLIPPNETIYFEVEILKIETD